LRMMTIGGNEPLAKSTNEFFHWSRTALELENGK
jgi:hypothetical protein